MPFSVPAVMTTPPVSFLVSRSASTPLEGRAEFSEVWTDQVFLLYLAMPPPIVPNHIEPSEAASMA